MEVLGRGSASLDSGTREIADAGQLFVHTIESHRGLKIVCPEEAAYQMGYIGGKQLARLGCNAPQERLW